MSKNIVRFVRQSLEKTDAMSSYWQWFDGLDILKSDASQRVYYRVKLRDSSRKKLMTKKLMVMDGRGLDLTPFEIIDQRLEKLGIRVPYIVNTDHKEGLMLLEDLGLRDFAVMLKENPHSEADLYRLAVETLINIQKTPKIHQVSDVQYSQEILLEEVNRFIQWYLPYERSVQTDTSSFSNDYDGLSESWRAIWIDVLAQMPQLPPHLETSLVLLDYIPENLIYLSKENPPACGLIDFQDARYGSAAYDLMSLLEDARRDVAPAIKSWALDFYKVEMAISDQVWADFRVCYDILALQRLFKILGIFARLKVQEDRAHYLKHIPGIKNNIHTLMNGKHSEKHFHGVKTWLQVNLNQ